MNAVTECLTNHDTPSDHIAQSNKDPKSRRLAKRLKLETYPEFVTTALHETFYTNAYLPCTCSEKGRAVCLSEEYVCALRLDGEHQEPGDDTHCFFDSVIAEKDDQNQRWKPIQFQLLRLVDARNSASPAKSAPGKSQTRPNP